MKSDPQLNKMLRNYISWAIIYLALSSCNSSNSFKDSVLIKSLEAAGHNRPELEKTLAHYSEPKDSLKYQAAVFLIRNMPGKYAEVFSNYDDYKIVFDTLSQLTKAYEKTFTPNNAEFFKFYKQTVINDFAYTREIDIKSKPEFEIKTDIENISASYLIENIDYAFKAWALPRTQFCAIIYEK